MSQTLARIAPFAVMAALAFQCVVTAKRGEPYPAVIMPRFGSVPKGDSIHRATVTIQENETQVTLSQFDFLSDIVHSHHGAIGRRLRQPPTDNIRHWLRDRCARLGFPDARRVIFRTHRHSPPENETPAECTREFTIELQP